MQHPSTGQPADPLPPVCVHALVRAQAQRVPDADAVVCDGRRMSYRELMAAASAVAIGLRNRGSGAESLIGVCVPRSPEMVIAVLGILLSGSAYLPVDAQAPPARVQHMLATGVVHTVLTTAAARAAWPELPGLELADINEVAAGPTGPADWPTALDDLAYVLFTSGSTGLPKGVAMSHRPLRNLIEHQLAASAAHHGGRRMRTMQFTPLTFDVSFLDIFSTLAAGGTVVLPGEHERRDPVHLLAIIRAEEITSLFLPLVALQELADTAVAAQHPATSLCEVMTGGQQLVITSSITDWFAAMPGCTLQNIYGPSETHLVTALDLQGDPSRWPRLPSIGHPIDGAQLSVRNTAGQPVPPGEPGELWISGTCLARGYFGEPALTAERFVTPDPGGPRHYRTGDLARELPDGGYQFLGRTDDQVKIQGVRVEPAEIESILISHPGVAACAVVARDRPGGEKRLVAYVVPRRPAGPDDAHPIGEWRGFLRSRLPAPLVPTAWMCQERLPLTSSGKIDLRALPDVPRQRPPLTTPLVLPRTTTERLVAAAWAEILDLDLVGADDNFFDLGGTSLLAIRAARRLGERLSTELDLATFFEHPTVAQMAAHLTANTEALPRIP